MQDRPRRVFVQFINPELLALYGCQHTDIQLLEIATKVARVGLMVAEDGLILPRSYLMEVEIVERFLDYLKVASAAGLVQVSSESPAALEFLAKKRREYRTQLEMFPGYSDEGAAMDLDSSLWTPRARSSSKDISEAWVEQLKGGGLWQEILAQGARPYLNRPLGRIEREIETTPYRLDGRAFIFRYVDELLPLTLDPSQRVGVEMLISRSYLLSYMAEYQASVLIDLPIGRFDCGLADELDPGVVVSFRRLRDFLTLLGISSQIVSSMSPVALIRLRLEPMWQWLMERYFENAIDPQRPLMGAMMAARFKGFERLRKNSVEAVAERIGEFHRAVEKELPAQLELGSDIHTPSVSPELDQRSKRLDSSRFTMPLLPRKPNDIFLVQGRDAKATEGLKAVLRAADLRPIEWEEARSWTGSPMPFTLQVLEAAFERVGAVVVLFTPDDGVKLREDLLGEGDPDYERDGGFQARPNVLVEAGMSLALHRNRTVIVEIGRGMRPTTDLDGLNVVRFSGDAADRAKLIGRLKDCGCEPRGEEYLTVPGFDYLKVEEEQT
jgi:predicted nucleotide-binding protein